MNAEINSIKKVSTHCLTQISRRSKTEKNTKGKKHESFEIALNIRIVCTRNTIKIIFLLVKNNRKIHFRGRFSSTKQSLDVFKCNEKKTFNIYLFYYLMRDSTRTIECSMSKKIKRNKNEIKKFTKQKTNEQRIIEGLSVIVFIFISKICLPQE